MVSIVIPVYQSAAQLKRCLAGISSSDTTPLETLVVDDGSTDRSADVARQSGAVVVEVPNGPRGPAAARNIGAARAAGDVILFLDADVVVHTDAIAKVDRCFSANPDVAAVFGSYDDEPEHRSMVSQYRNLVHHFVHHQGSREASTFWAGCGAVRRKVFADSGGFDERYARPSIEDIELGGRLREAGHRILLCPDIQGTHLKRWTFADVVRCDIRDRAIPWTRLILRQGRIPQDLNTTTASRLGAVAVWTVVVAALAALVVPRALWVSIGALALLIGLNARLYGFFLRKRGLAFAVVAIGMHALYLLYSSAIFLSLATVNRFLADTAEN